MANDIEIKIPDIGDFDKVPVIEILVAVGDEIKLDDSLVTLESDKATMEVPSSHAGKITSLKVSEGDQVGEGDVIATLESMDDSNDEKESSDDSPYVDANSDADGQSETHDSEDNDAQAEPDTMAHSQADTAQTSNEMSNDSADNIHASPSVRKLARKLAVDLSAVKATGRKGRISEDDLHKHLKQRMSGSSTSGGIEGLSIAPAKQVDYSKFGDIEEQALSRIQKISGAHLHRNWLTIPHVTQHDHADITDLEAFRKQQDAEIREQGTRLTLIVFLIKACVAALKKFPQFNSSLSSDGESLIMKKYFHIGIAVDTSDGLVVPVIRNCDQKGLLELAHELTDLSSRAREGKLKPAEMQGGCFSISSLGGIGGTGFTPIVNGPEVAILGVSRSAMSPVWNGEQFNPRLMLPLSLSYDHRVIDGAAAARFARFLVTRLEDFRRVVL